MGIIGVPYHPCVCVCVGEGGGGAGGSKWS